MHVKHLVMNDDVYHRMRVRMPYLQCLFVSSEAVERGTRVCVVSTLFSSSEAVEGMMYYLQFMFSSSEAVNRG